MDSAFKLSEDNNIMNNHSIQCAFIAMCLLGTAAAPAMAQTAYPDRVLRLIVPFAAGSATDS